MNELHKQVRKDAEALLDELVCEAQDSIHRIAKGSGIPDTMLMRLAIGGRTESIHKKAASILAKEMEKELLDLYQKKPELKAVGGKE